MFKPTAGTVEIVFKHLLIRPPFDDTAVRDELRQRINCIPGVDVPLARLELRPTFPLMRLLGQLVSSGVLREQDVWSVLPGAASLHIGVAGFTESKMRASIRSGLTAGIRRPRYPTRQPRREADA